jgi:hypothetical protein
VTAEPPTALSALTTFTTTVTSHPDRTTLDVSTSRQAPPLARLSKAGPLRKRAAYELFTGPDLKEVAFQVTASGAQTLEGVPVGIVNLSGGKVPDGQIHPMSGSHQTYVVNNPTRWRVVQPGLPVLTGKAGNRGTRLRYNRVTELSQNAGVELWTPEFLMEMNFRFRAPGNEGFTVKLSARRARFEVTVHDPRVDRVLVCACLTAMAALIM